MIPAATLESLHARLGPRARTGESLALHTSYRIGGPADLLLPATSADELVGALRAARDLDVPCRVIGGASNLLVADEGIAGLVLKALLTGTRYEPAPDDPDAVLLTAAAGSQLASVARQSAKRGLAGLVWASNVPGTVGAAVVNNAGAFGSATAEVLERALLVDADGRTYTLGPADLAMAYRTTRLKRRELDLAVLEATFRLRRGDAAALLAEVRAVRSRRQETQPSGFSAGSMFANPPGDASGRLIETAGLKGRQVGGAQVSPLHANFIVNVGGATARDVYRLMREVQDTVYARHGVWLLPEVQLVGRWAPAELAALAAPPAAAVADPRGDARNAVEV